MEALGIDIKLLIAQIINFLILLFILNKVLYKPILNILQKRKEAIETGIKQSAEAQEQLSQAVDEAKKIIASANQRAENILKEAQKEADIEANNIIVKATRQAEKVREQAREDSINLETTALSQAKKQLGGLVLTALNRIIGNFKLEDKEKLVKEAIKELS